MPSQALSLGGADEPAASSSRPSAPDANRPGQSGSLPPPPHTPRRRRKSSLWEGLLSPRPHHHRADDEHTLDPLFFEDFVQHEHVRVFMDALRGVDHAELQPSVSAFPGKSAAELGDDHDALHRISAASGAGAASALDSEAAVVETEFDSASLTGDSDLDRGGGGGGGGGGNNGNNGFGGRPDAPRPLPRGAQPRRVRPITAASDFTPIREPLQRRRRGERQRGKRIDSGRREGLTYQIFRFPLLLIIFAFIVVEFVLYVMVRQFVNIMEYSFAWWGKRGVLRYHLRRSKTYEEWQKWALALDEHLGLEGWKKEDASGLYDWVLVRKALDRLETFREMDDAEAVLDTLEVCLRHNFAGTGNWKLYSHTFLGTKQLVEHYAEEVERCLEYLEDTAKIPPEEKRRFYRLVSRNFGRSALCLSGGGCLAYNHFGVVRELLDHGILPSLLTGTSGGGLAAALTCTRTDDELRRLLVPELAHKITACEESIRVWLPRFLRTGARFDPQKWAEKSMWFTRGSTTFQEAYERTGRVLNVTVVPSSKHSPVKVLNHVTAPNCIIWSTLIASAAVPGLLPPVCLLAKTKDGRAVPFSFGSRFRDGTMRSDIPTKDLHSLFSVNFPIVSQVNPHVKLFFYSNQGMPGRPISHRNTKSWRGGFLSSVAEKALKIQLLSQLKLLQDLELLPEVAGSDFSSVMLQNFGGAVTILPRIKAHHFLKLLSDPSVGELARMFHAGALATWPRMRMVQHRVRIELALERGRRKVRQALKTPLAEATATPADGGDGAAVDYLSARRQRNGGVGGGVNDAASSQGAARVGGTRGARQRRLDISWSLSSERRHDDTSSSEDD